MSLDHRTRGRTSAARLHALDEFVLRAERGLLLQAGSSPFVDVGFGERPETTLASALLFREVNPALPVVGLEIEAHRVENARAFEDAQTRFVLGGFEAVPPGARLIRVMNVLRAYPVERIAPIHALLGEALIEGGLAIDGTSDPGGDILTAHLLRKRNGALHREALLFHASGATGFAPLLFRDWLPRDLRRRVKPGEWIHALLERWTSVWSRVRTPDPSESFVRSAHAWAASGEPVELVDDGLVVWRPRDGVPS